MICQVLRRQAGASKLELVVVVLIFAMLMAVYLRYTRHYQEMAEEAAVNVLLSNIRVGMAQEWVERIAKSKTREGVAELVGTNPVRWLDSPPAGYLGELKLPKVDTLAAGSWFYDISRRELVYVVKLGDNLEIVGSLPRKMLRWKVISSDNSLTITPDFGDLILAPVVDYRWF